MVVDNHIYAWVLFIPFAAITTLRLMMRRILWRNNLIKTKQNL
jgi:hypothetical protein